MKIGKKFNSSLLAAGCVIALAAAASPASAQSTAQPSFQWGPQSGSIGASATREGSKIRISANLTLPAGASVSGKVQFGKRVLCRTAKRKQVTEGATTTVSCTFPAKYFKAKKSGARSSASTPVAIPISQEQYVKMAIAVTLAVIEEELPVPIVVIIPIFIWTAVAQGG